MFFDHLNHGVHDTKELSRQGNEGKFVLYLKGTDQII